ncbi:MAG TPA: nuclear transport factor 2 family protein [Methylobacter sp.]|jgi:hypothetical protein
MAAILPIRLMGFVNPESIEGARMLMESFYFAFNHRNMEVFSAVWANHELIQLNNPLGGILRGYEAIAALYEQVFTGAASVWVELSDIVEFQTENMVVFAGRESGEFTKNNQTLPLSIRTSRVIQWFGPETGWKQVHHHGSIDDPELLHLYQQEVRGD